MRYRLGIVAITFGRELAPIEIAARAKALGFEHIDIASDCEDDLALPIADRISLTPRAGFSVPAPPEADGMWDRAVRAYRRCPGMRLEPWGGSICNTVEKVVAMIAEVPGLRLVVDTGHVVGWGEDPVQLLPWADHVQLRQARPGMVQASEGDVDFEEIVDNLDRLAYKGCLSVEYFDLPEWGWPLEDPIGYATALAAQVRPILDR
jgi:sugar phosphate isomerase/epimerase